MLLQDDVWSGVCSACEWARLYPRSDTHPEGELQNEFHWHVCADYPRPRKQREDVNQTAARVVWEATRD